MLRGIAALQGALAAAFPKVVASGEGFVSGQVASPAYVAFVFEKAREFHENNDLPKAARWLGWGVAHAGVMGVINDPMVRVARFEQGCSSPWYYQGTIRELHLLIQNAPPTLAAGTIDLGPIASRRRLLAVVEHIARMRSRDTATAESAGFHLGWVLAHAELRGLLTNARSRDLVRADKKLGFE